MLGETTTQTKIGPIQEKRRRIDRACGACREQKRRCEGFDENGQKKCQRCERFGLDCRNDAPKQKNGPRKRYVRELEARLKNMEVLIQRLHPDLENSSLPKYPSSSSKYSQELQVTDSKHPVGGERSIGAAQKQNLVNTRVVTDPGQHAASHLLEFEHSSQAVSGYPVRSSLLGHSSDDSVTDSDGSISGDEAHHLNISGTNFEEGYQGESSRGRLVKDVLELRSEYLSKSLAGRSADEGGKKPSRRAEMWASLPWDPLTNPAQSDVSYTFPPSDLLPQLVERYFRTLNTAMPMFNEVLFKRQVAKELHLRDTGFAVVLLLVAAVGARGSTDPRVYLDTEHTHTAGWMWFSQVQNALTQFTMGPPTVYKVQAFFLIAAFAQSTSEPGAGWLSVGIGLRIAVSAGAHRRKTYGSKPTVNRELWKRTFWALIWLDRHISNHVGRPCSLRDEDFDVDLPVECDDEYWFADGDAQFKQPAGKPCQISHMIHFIKYFQLVVFVLRTIYATNHSKAFLGLVGPDWKKRIVTECDSSLNEWRAAIREHLRWDPENMAPEFVLRAAHLETFYYMLQITIHRPFIVGPHRQASAAFPSLEICTNAARSIAKVLKVLHERNIGPAPWEFIAAFTAGIALILSIWGNKKGSLISDSADERVEGLHICMRILKRAEKSWHQAAQYWDILFELASFGKIPMAADFIFRETTGKSKADLTLKAQQAQTAFPSISDVEEATRPTSPAFNSFVSHWGDNELSSQTGTLATLDTATDTQFLLETSTCLPTSSQTQWNIFSTPPMQEISFDSPYLNKNQFAWSSDDTTFEGLQLSDPTAYNAASLWSGAPSKFDLNQWNQYVDYIATILDQTSSYSGTDMHRVD